MSVKRIPLIVFMMLPHLAMGQSQVQVTGVGTIMNNDVAAARDRAIDDALRKAVEGTLGTYIDAQTKVENFMVVEDRILNWSRG